MADEVTTATQSDMFTALQKTNQALLDVLTNRLQSQPTYVQSVQPAATPSPNYLLYAGLAVGAFLLLRKGKIL
jgi:hypothetical protein